jgi:hypothetical protein
MATTGVKAPTAAQSISESPWSDNDWTTPENIYGAGEASVTAATFDAGDQTYVLKAYGFDFSAIPDNAKIDGVQVIINARYATVVVSLDLAQLLDISRAKVGTNQYATPQALTTSAANYSKGGSTDKWGNALTAAWVKDPDFGVAIGCLAGGSGNSNNDVYIDSVTMEVWYTVPTTYTKTLNLDSYLKAIYSKTPAVDGVLQRLDQIKSVSADGLLQKLAQVKTSSLDAYIYNLLLKTLGADGILRKLGLDKTASIDAFLQSIGLTASSSLDAILFAVITKTLSVSADGLLQKGQSGMISLDSYLRGSFSGTATADSLLQKLGQLKNTSLDGYLYKTFLAALGTDGILQKLGLTETVSIDTLLQKLGLAGTCSLDAILYVLGGQILTVSIDALIQKSQTRSASLDSFLQKPGTKASSLDALIVMIGIQSLGIDGILQRVMSEGTSLDAILIPGEGQAIKTLFLDALIASMNRPISSSLDAWLIGPQPERIEVGFEMNRPETAVGMPSGSADFIMKGGSTQIDLSED